MYKIDFYNKTSVLIKEGINPDFGDANLTYLEIEQRNASNKYYIYFQDILPHCDAKYWKIDNGVVVEMNESEKVYKDAKDLYLEKLKENYGLRYHVSVSFSYISSIQAYRPLIDWAFAMNNNPKNCVKCFIEPSEAGISNIYFNEFAIGHKKIIENDPNFTIFDVETINPDK
jgi:hypothetical protein